MGKITSIYLTDEEAAELKKFCAENQCTQYSALKTALRELLSKPIAEAETEQRETEEPSGNKEEIEKTPKSGRSALIRLAHALKSVERE